MADAVKTRQQLVNRALKNLAVIEAGETPSIEDYQSVDDLVDPLIAQLASDQVYYVSNPEEIENEIYLPLARLLANVAGPDFGSAMNEDAKLVDEAALRKISATRPTYVPLQAEYF